jgi:uncharacterized metal-binding protein (TIGR02443 family)
MADSSAKRFIAGAVCPRCGEMDRLVTFEKEGKSLRECVSCDFTEEQVANVVSSEIQTRVNQFEEVGAEDDVAAVKILDPKSIH